MALAPRSSPSPACMTSWRSGRAYFLPMIPLANGILMSLDPCGMLVPGAWVPGAEL
jgi:hypothetical protein